MGDKTSITGGFGMVKSGIGWCISPRSFIGGWGIICLDRGEVQALDHLSSWLRSKRRKLEKDKFLLRYSHPQRIRRLSIIHRFVYRYTLTFHINFHLDLAFLFWGHFPWGSYIVLDEKLRFPREAELDVNGFSVISLRDFHVFDRITFS